MTNTILYPSAGKGVQLHPDPRIFSLKPPHSSPVQRGQKFCTPLSCAGQSYPARMGGRMTADGFSCITPICEVVDLLHCGAAESGETPCGNCNTPGWWRSRSRAVENPTAFSPKSYEAVSKRRLQEIPFWYAGGLKTVPMKYGKPPP